MNCPDCGLPPATTGQNADTGAVIFSCAAGHTWTGEIADPGKPASPPERRRRKPVSKPAATDEQETST